MKSTGIVRRVDQLGRIVLPKELRRTFNVYEMVDSLEIYVEGNSIVLKKYDFTINTAGIVRKIDQLGRIVLPIELRKKLGIVEEKDSLEIYIDNDSIILKKYEPACIFCGNASDTITYKGRNICKECISEMSK